MERVNVEFARQIAPYFLFFERVLTRPVELFTFEIAYGYGYYLRRFVCRYDGVNTSAGTLAPPLFIEFFDNWNCRARQVKPIPLPLISTPNNGGNVEHEVQSFTPHLFTVKTARTSEKLLNNFHPYRDILRFQITGGGVPWSTYMGDIYPSIEIMIDGYYVPEQSLSLWTKTRGQAQMVRGKPVKKWIKI
jgi:hypothetical protein